MENSENKIGSCRTCKHWRESSEYFNKGAAMGECRAVLEAHGDAYANDVMLWNPEIRRYEVKKVFESARAFAGDAPGFLASLITTHDFGCVQ